MDTMPGAMTVDATTNVMRVDATADTATMDVMTVGAMNRAPTTLEFRRGTTRRARHLL
jgi:hypothetical protein